MGNEGELGKDLKVPFDGYKKPVWGRILLRRDLSWLQIIMNEDTEKVWKESPKKKGRNLPGFLTKYL